MVPEEHPRVEPLGNLRFIIADFNQLSSNLIANADSVIAVI